MKKSFAKQILIAVNLLILAFLLSLMMAVRIIEPSYILLFASVSMSVAGLAIGFYAIGEKFGWRVTNKRGI